MRSGLAKEGHHTDFKIAKVLQMLRLFYMKFSWNSISKFRTREWHSEMTSLGLFMSLTLINRLLENI
ncbi:hypothetical protein C5167_032905 [Papaver somniferum]|uniref:Uncharacterized protein n=1 Tax=Papaver somniferum TaxID=3469 RepID=A0A4Y7KCA4_PAPSO|nr:hypothetical protein C5167_032905 [Papaver somniferum]